MQSKTTMRYYITSVIKTENSKCDEDVEKLESLCTTDGNIKWCGSCGKQYGGSAKKKKLKTEQLCDPVILLLGIYKKKT